MTEPGVTFCDTDHERRVPHPQSGMSAQVRVRRRTSPVLDQEQGQPIRSGTEVVLGVQRPQEWIHRDTGVETLDQQPKRGLATGTFEEACVYQRTAP
jgi:hypothetical protein